MIPTSMAIAADMHYCAQNRCVHYHLAEHEFFRDFSVLVGKLQRKVIQALGEEHDIVLLRALKSYRFRLSALPIPFDHPIVAPRLSLSEMKAWVSEHSEAYPSLAGPARDAVDAFALLRECQDNPLLDVTLRLERPSGSFTVLVRESKYVRAVRDEFARRGLDTEFRVVGLGDLEPSVFHERIVVVGSTRWFPDHVFSAPVAPDVDVVSYRWNWSRWRRTQAFLGAMSGSADSNEPDFGESPDPDDELATEFEWPIINWASIARHAVDQASSCDHDRDFQETIEARLFSLAGGFAVFLEAEEGATALAIDPRDDRRGGVGRVRTRDIEPGMFVILRTLGGGDYVVPVANRILGTEASNCREAQSRWKAKLREHVRREGALDIALRLLEFGGERADEQNIRNWMSERNIGTQGRNDFAAIMRLIGLEAETDRYWDTTRLIRTAHLRAGMTIRRRLIEQVRQLDITDTRKSERIDVALPEAEGGRLTAFRIEAAAPITVTISLSQLERVFPAED